MKRLSAVLIGAFMLFGVNSVVALEGSNDYQLAPSASAISAAQNMSWPEGDKVCADRPVSGYGEGVSIERECVITFDQGDVSAMGPQFDTPQN